MLESSVSGNHGASPQHGLSSIMMALITSDCGLMQTLTWSSTPRAVAIATWQRRHILQVRSPAAHIAHIDVSIDVVVLCITAIVVPRSNPARLLPLEDSVVGRLGVVLTKVAVAADGAVVSMDRVHVDDLVHLRVRQRHPTRAAVT